MYTEKKSWKPSKLVVGIILMIINAAAISSTYVIAKMLGKSISGDQVAFLYKAGGLFFTVPLLFKEGMMNNLKTEKIGLHILRSFLSLGAAICFYRGLIHVTATDATAITFLEPILGLVVGFLYFKEEITKTKILSVTLCLIGTLFIIRPGLKNFNMSYAYLLGALFLWAMNNLTIKVLGRTERTSATAFYMSLFTTIFAFPVAMQHSWAALDWTYMKYIVIMTICHLTHTICFFRALKMTDISVIMPFDYTRLIFTGLLSYIFLSEYPTSLSIFGYSLITLGGMILVLHETKKHGWSRISEEKFIKEKVQK